MITRGGRFYKNVYFFVKLDSASSITENSMIFPIFRVFMGFFKRVQRFAERYAFVIAAPLSCARIKKWEMNGNECTVDWRTQPAHGHDG